MNVLILARVPIIREGLRALLSGEIDLQVTAFDPVAQSEPLLEEILAHDPDIVLLDVEVLEHDGWALLGDLSRSAPNVHNLVISDLPQDQRVARALTLGARGYLLRDASREEMIAAIRAARRDLYVLHPVAAETLLTLWQERELRLSDDDSEDIGARNAELIEPLSERELEVLRWMSRGLANKQIAAELFVTEHTIKFHIRAILGKLGAANRTEAVTLALQKGLVTL